VLVKYKPGRRDGPNKREFCIFESMSGEPLPRVLGYSPKDEIAAIGFFLGAPNNPEKLKDYGEHHAATFHLPDAYLGSNAKLRDTLNNLVLHSPQQWQTEVALPFRKVEGTTVEWDTIQFNVGLMARVPPEGVSRMQTALRRRHRARVVRRGIGLMIESDFYATEAGRKHFTDQLTSIRYCVQETCNFDVLYAYLASENYDFRYDIMKGLRSKRSIKNAMQHDIMMYGIVQKQGLGFDRAVEESKCRMARYQVTPDMIVVPPQLLLYVAMSPEEKIKYSEGGPTAVTRFEQGKNGYETRAFRGMGVFESLPYEVGSDEDSMQLLQRHTQVGEFYRMSPPVAYNESMPLPSCYMDIVIYDEDADQHVHITFQEAAKAALIDNGDFMKNDPCKVKKWFDQRKGDFFHSDRETFTQAFERNADDLTTYLGTSNGKTFDKMEKDISGDLNAISKGIFQRVIGAGFDEEAYKQREDLGSKDENQVRDTTSSQQLRVLMMRALAHVLKHGSEEDKVGFMSLVLLTTANPQMEKINFKRIYQLLSTLSSAGVWVPLSITIARPFIEHITMSAVLTKAGEDTGVTLFGPADMQISANTSVKTVEGHYTCNTKAVVSKPQNVLVMRDIMCNGYVGGSNTKFFGSDGKKHLSGAFDAGKAQQELANRANGEGEVVASMLAFFVPSDEDDDAHRDTVISVANRGVPWETSTDGNLVSMFPGGEDNFTAYNKLLSLADIHQGEDPYAMASQDYFASSNSMNSVCFLGPHRKFNPFSSTGFQLVTGQGHFGADAIPGDARWRRGEMVSLEAARNSVVSLELAAQSQMAFRPRNY
jgi:hypothetical protein